MWVGEHAYVESVAGSGENFGVGSDIQQNPHHPI